MPPASEVRPLILNLGSGPDYRKEAVNIDLYAEKADIRADVRHLDMFENNTVKMIMALNILEHFRWDDGYEAVKEWHRVLEPGGELVISVPNMEEVFKTLADFPEVLRDHAMWMVFGWQEAGPGMEHKSGYTPRSLKALMERVGFEVIWCDFNKPKRPTPSVRVIGVKR